MAIKFGQGKKPAGTGTAAGKPGVAARGSSGNGQGASLLPTDWTAGGLLNDADVLITDMTWVDDWTYNGTISDPVLALKVTFQQEDGESVEQCFSAGDLARWVPDKKSNNKRVVPAPNSTAKALNNNTNCAAFLGSLIEHGFPTDAKGHEVGDMVDVFEGTFCHVMRVPQKKRSGIAQPDAKERDVLVVSEVLRLPWEKAGTKTAARPASGATAAAAGGKANGKAVAAHAAPAEEEETEVDPAIVEEAAGMVAAVLEEKGGSVAAGQLSIALLKHVAGNDNRAAILAMVKDPEFLGMEGAPWSYDGKTISAE